MTLCVCRLEIRTPFDRWGALRAKVKSEVTRSGGFQTAGAIWKSPFLDCQSAALDNPTPAISIF
jgi:hypothetical protein